MEADSALPALAHHHEDDIAALRELAVQAIVRLTQLEHEVTMLRKMVGPLRMES